jgi:hypothetical protein
MDIAFLYLKNQSFDFKSDYTEKEIDEKNNTVKLKENTDPFTVTQRPEKSKKDFNFFKKAAFFLIALITLPVRALFVQRKNSLLRIHPISIKQTFRIVKQSECAALFYSRSEYSESTGTFTAPKFEYGEELSASSPEYFYNENNVNRCLYFEKISAAASVTGLFLIAAAVFIYGYVIEATILAMISIGMIIIFIPLSVWIIKRTKKRAERVREISMRALRYISNGVKND